MIGSRRGKLGAGVVAHTPATRIVVHLPTCPHPTSAPLFLFPAGVHSRGGRGGRWGRRWGAGRRGGRRPGSWTGPSTSTPAPPPSSAASHPVPQHPHSHFIPHQSQPAMPPLLVQTRLPSYVLHEANWGQIASAPDNMRPNRARSRVPSATFSSPSPSTSFPSPLP